MATKAEGEKLLYCSFCGKSQHEVNAGFTNRPLELHVCDVFANRFAVLFWKTFQPVTYRLVAVGASVKNGIELLLTGH